MQNKQQHNDYSSSASTTEHHDHHNNYAHAAVRFMSPEDCEAIKTAYIENINSEFMPGAVAHMIEDAFKAGLSADEIVLAIEETGFAPRPTPHYLRKVLQNWAESGCVMSRRRPNMSHPNYDVKPWWR